ncbi:MAG: hypothetical protein H6Q05_2027 [Acidobacteria bacterium]|nr:hypothetical protein [Acidobacteriota bacterium]
MSTKKRTSDERPEFRTEFDDLDQSSHSSLYEITARVDGKIRRIVLEATNRKEAEEIFRSLPSIGSDTPVIEIKRTMWGIYWVPVRDNALLKAAKATMRLWDKHGLGDEEDESEPVYRALKNAIVRS